MISSEFIISSAEMTIYLKFRTNESNINCQLGGSLDDIHDFTSHSRNPEQQAIFPSPLAYYYLIIHDHRSWRNFIFLHFSPTCRSAGNRPNLLFLTTTSIS